MEGIKKRWNRDGWRGLREDGIHRDGWRGLREDGIHRDGWRG